MSGCCGGCAPRADELHRVFHWYHTLGAFAEPRVSIHRLHELVQDCCLLGGFLTYGDVAVAFYETRGLSRMWLVACVQRGGVSGVRVTAAAVTGGALTRVFDGAR